MDLFGTAGIRGDVVERITPELALSVGRAVGLDAGGEADTSIVIARDGRETGPALLAALEAGLESAGANVRHAGILPTPALAFASRGCHGAMLTASHNPPHDNGIKLFRDGTEYDHEAEQRIEAGVASSSSPATWDEWGECESIAVLDNYRSAVADYARSVGVAPDGLRIAVDCGNGTAGLATPQVLEELGVDVVALNANVDGYFPARASKPTPESLADFRAFVADGQFDLGVAHDGDADRIAVVDAAGEVVHEDTVLAIIAHRYVRGSDAPDPVVLTTPNASARIDERVEEAGGRTERVRLGALHEGIERVRDGGGDLVFAAEPWKHIHPTFGGWIDGVASAAVLARFVSAAGGLATLREPVSERPYRKLSVACPDDRKRGAMERAQTLLEDAFPEAEVDTNYGVRLDFPAGAWLLVRPSGTEPYLRLYAESDDADALASEAKSIIETAIECRGSDR